MRGGKVDYMDIIGLYGYIWIIYIIYINYTQFNFICITFIPLTIYTKPYQ